ncbi:PREDICTED: SLAIN motif-containing protein 1-like [Priapulus caudatus]|uniref:SLAIN motif-containing protein 1-like n=1 Tax=Priapulus caudatus TaxID=37621 RepID=A0ABM1EI51_PRICU|nr:PREDICTED: SLAIN motif-containing protein 1-like [Priapulus caudatus]
MDKGVDSKGRHEEVEQLKDLVRKLEIQNKELRKNRERSRNGCIENHNESGSDLCNDSVNANETLEDSGSEHGECDISLDTVDLLDVGSDDCTDEEDSWLFESPKQPTPQQKAVSPYKWIRKDYDEDPNPDLQFTRKRLVYKLDEIILSSPLSPMVRGGSPGKGIASYSSVSDLRLHQHGRVDASPTVPYIPRSASFSGGPPLLQQRGPATTYALRRGPAGVLGDDSSTSTDEDVYMAASVQSPRRRCEGSLDATSRPYRVPRNAAAHSSSSHQRARSPPSSQAPRPRNGQPRAASADVPGRHAVAPPAERHSDSNAAMRAAEDYSPMSASDSSPESDSYSQQVHGSLHQGLRQSFSATRRGSASTDSMHGTPGQGSPLPVAPPQNGYSRVHTADQTAPPRRSIPSPSRSQQAHRVQQYNALSQEQRRFGSDSRLQQSMLRADGRTGSDSTLQHFAQDNKGGKAAKVSPPRPSLSQQRVQQPQRSIPVPKMSPASKLAVHVSRIGNPRN